jgi:hypothetical protein
MRKNRFYFTIAALCLALAVMACNAATSALNSSGGSGNSGNPTTSTGSTAVSSTSTSNVSGNKGKVLFQDDFSDSNSGWGTGSDANKYVDYSNNSLEFKVFKANDFVYSTPNETNYQDVHVEVTVTPSNSDKNTAFGILCDQQVTHDSFYYAAVTLSGQYAIVLAAVAKDDVFLTNNNDWGTSDFIPANASSYTIGMDCGGDGALALYVNGQKIDSANDSTYTDGHIGLFAWSGKNANATDVSFANYVASSLK